MWTHTWKNGWEWSLMTAKFGWFIHRQTETPHRELININSSRRKIPDATSPHQLPCNLIHRLFVVIRQIQMSLYAGNDEYKDYYFSRGSVCPIRGPSLRVSTSWSFSNIHIFSRRWSTLRVMAAHRGTSIRARLSGFSSDTLFLPFSLFNTN